MTPVKRLDGREPGTRGVHECPESRVRDAGGSDMLSEAAPCAVPPEGDVVSQEDLGGSRPRELLLALLALGVVLALVVVAVVDWLLR